MPSRRTTASESVVGSGTLAGPPSKALNGRVSPGRTCRSRLCRRVLRGQLSQRAACREYDLSWHTLKKILQHGEPPGYQQQPRCKPKLAPFLPIIHQILEDDREAPKKQRHTAWRIFERLRDEHDRKVMENNVIWRKWVYTTVSCWRHGNHAHPTIRKTPSGEKPRRARTQTGSARWPRGGDRGGNRDGNNAAGKGKSNGDAG